MPVCRVPDEVNSKILSPKPCGFELGSDQAKSVTMKGINITEGRKMGLARDFRPCFFVLRDFVKQGLPYFARMRSIWVGIGAESGSD